MAMRPLLLQLLLLSGLSVVSIASLSFRRPMRDPSNSRASVPYRSSSFSSCRHVPGLDFGDAGWSAQGSTPDECCQRCIATTGCAAVVYAQGVCYFKNSTFAPKQGEAGAIACTPEAALPPASQLRSRLGATHWNGCYNRSTEPFVLDGAKTVYDMGSRVLKVALFNPERNYPWNSDWPESSSFASAAAMANHTYYRQLFSMDFDTFVLVAYSTNGEGDINYWNKGISDMQVANETRQFHDLTLFLSQTFPTKTFVLQHWEGDWSARGNYNATAPPSDAAVHAMRQWLGARQAGVSAARKELGGKATVLCASEVNLVFTSMTKGFPNIIDSVIPYVPLDLISYSSYDTMCTSAFLPALRYIAAHHNRTEASPPVGVYVGEFGEQARLKPPNIVEDCVRNVITDALGAFGAPYVLYWEVYGNQVDGIKGVTRCEAKKDGGYGPVYNASQLDGFWLVMPNGTRAWPYNYINGLLSDPVAPLL